MRAPQIADLIAQEHHGQVEGIELIVSENYTSDSVMEAQCSILTNKYAEGLPLRRYYGGVLCASNAISPKNRQSHHP